MNRSKYFLYVGNAYPHKNLNRLIEAVIQLNKNSDQNIKLKIVSGKSTFYERLIRTIKKLQAKNYVEILGYVDDRQLFSLYKNSIAYVFPSLSEGFGLPGLEAIEAGTLLLASRIPVFSEVYKEHAIYFDPLSVDTITLTMQKALSMKSDERKKRIARSQEFAKRYSWSKMARQTLDVYEKSFKEESRNSV